MQGAVNTGAGGGNTPTPSICIVPDNGTYYVKTSGSDSTGTGSQGCPFASIQKAIDTAASNNIVGGEVRVAAGTYEVTEPIQISSDAIPLWWHGVAIMGGYNNSSWDDRKFITDTDRANTTYKTVVVYTGSDVGSVNFSDLPSSDFAPTIRISGSDIDQDHTIVEGLTINARAGGTLTSAIECNSGAAPLIKNNTINGGTADLDTYGIALPLASPSIDSNYIYGGTGACGAYNIATITSDATITNNVLVGGTNLTGANNCGPSTIWLANGSPTIMNNTLIAPNKSDDSYLWVMTINDISGEPGHATIENNLFYMNGSPTGWTGGVYIGRTSLAPASFKNNDIFGSFTCQFQDGGCFDVIEVNSSFPSFASANISADPVFEDVLSLDFHLTASTPTAVAIGGLDLSSEVPLDKDGVTRALPFTIGAYEFIAIPKVGLIPIITSISPNSAFTTSQGLSPGGTSITITGAYLADPLSLKIGSTSLSVSSSTDTQVIAVIPAGLAVGTYDITVTTIAGTSPISNADQFTFILPPPSPVTTFGDSNLERPFMIATDLSGNVYVTDSQGGYSGAGHHNSVIKYTSNGVFVTQWGTYGSGSGQFSSPTGIAVDSVNNFVYVADLYNNRIQKFDTSGNYLAQWGSLNEPVGVALDASGNVYVADMNDNCIKEFNSNGVYIAQFTGGLPSTPYGIAIDQATNIGYITSASDNMIYRFLSGSGTLGGGNSSGIAVDSTGNIYASNAVGGRGGTVSKYAANGTLLGQFGTYGSGSGQFRWPMGIAVDPSGYIYVADFTNANIQKFVPDI
jgi:DNA-binding beta-propeller fold protein YncE